MPLNETGHQITLGLNEIDDFGCNAQFSCNKIGLVFVFPFDAKQIGIFTGDAQVKGLPSTSTR